MLIVLWPLVYFVRVCVSLSLVWIIGRPSLLGFGLIMFGCFVLVWLDS